MNLKIKRIMIIVSVLIIALIGGLFILAEKHIRVKKELIIDKEISQVWEIMGNQFTEVHLWSTNFKNSKPGGQPKLEELDYLHRVTETERGETIQEIDIFDQTNHSITYHISKGAPKIAKSAVGIWSLESVETNKTKVIIEFKLETNGFIGLMLSPLIKLKLGKSTIEIEEELKFYAENRVAHPRKIESQKNQNTK
ncbi:MAG: hypothetical protein ACJASM_001819 [Salibacteraceae bacterium]|jgi:hypothetical protein